ncbi:MAG: HNH endonuclease signature motif containing protein [Stenomitos frigidus ULC029]
MPVFARGHNRFHSLLFLQERLGIRQKYDQVFSSSDVKQALEAAHTIPYNGKTNNISKGLLLRADLHTLFDLKLITVNPTRSTAQQV